jgi:hypothetical protein
VVDVNWVQTVVDAFASGTVAAAKDGATEAVKNAWNSLRARFTGHYSEVSTAAVEKLPDSALQRSALVESLVAAGAGADVELITLAVKLAEVIKADDPGAAETIGVDLSRINADEINIADIKASGGSTGVRASDISARAMNIQGVEARGDDPDHP